ncbi:O-methyltransferase [Kibdelosporangium phytohabitans]|uniref:SAM-dependent methyltransferase n=1 Tax=Kibdelosporangium phytohabitans TaxID=860235 RepID=A0A0N9I5W1_9PSEU|nr:class I SAM-dependent methyltransferase [Kibdelosporangium phytohabitans]ALG09970.1 SAM-dependent methyltransferase [Kibdelosporangium phytohabitans]MBE1468614.1 caffeoyl-CoA O-methyltransferase [Kibdelosporangium phytohabitans]
MRLIPVTDAIYDYIADHSTQVDEVHRDLVERARMRIGRDKGALLTLLTQLTNTRQAIEIGTFTGYATLCIARGLPAGGRVLTCDVSQEWTAVAERVWAHENVTAKIDLRLGTAIETLRALPPEPHHDLAFIGADKPGYLDYYEELLPRIRPGGAILINNVLLAGAVVTDPDDENARTMREFNAHVCADKRVDAVMLSVGDGITLARKRPVDSAD